MKKLNIILANASINNGNRGCVALTITSIYLLNEIFKRYGIHYELFLCNSGFPAHQNYKYKMLNEEIKYTTCGYPIDGHIKDNFKSFIKGELKKNTKIFKMADYVFDIGEGDSFADIYGQTRFNSINRIHKVAQLYNKQYCMLPQTIGPFENDSIRKMANQSINNSSLVMARDKQSLNYVLSNVPSQKNVDEYIDVAFFMPYRKKQFDSQFIHVGLNVSALLWNGGYTQNNQFNLTVDYQKLIYEIIDYFLNLPNVKVHLIPHVVLGEKNIENDYEVSFSIKEKYQHPNLILSEFFLGPIEAKNYIAGMDFFMGARMHSTIAAFSTGVPVIPMAYSRKFNGLFVDTLSYSYIADMKKDNNLAILSSIGEAFSNRLVLKSKIEFQQNTTIKKNKEKILEALCKYLKVQ